MMALRSLSTSSSFDAGLNPAGGAASSHALASAQPATRPPGMRPWGHHAHGFSSSSNSSRSLGATAASAPSSSPLSGPGSAIALQQVGVQLPERCCGCGIRLQQADPEAPGYFIVPAKLLDIAVSRLPIHRGVEDICLVPQIAVGGPPGPKPLHE